MFGGAPETGREGREQLIDAVDTHPVFADWPKDDWLTSFLANRGRLGVAAATFAVSLQ